MCTRWMEEEGDAPRLLWNRAFFRGSGHGSNGGRKHSCAAHTGFPKDLLDEKYSRSDEFRIKGAQLESRKPERASRRSGHSGLEFRLARYSRLFRLLRLKYFESHKYLDCCEKGDFR